MARAARPYHWWQIGTMLSPRQDIIYQWWNIFHSSPLFRWIISTAEFDLTKKKKYKISINCFLKDSERNSRYFQSHLCFALSHGLNITKEEPAIEWIDCAAAPITSTGCIHYHTRARSRCSGGEVIRVHTIYASWQLYNTNLHFADRQK